MFLQPAGWPRGALFQGRSWELGTWGSGSWQDGKETGQSDRDGKGQRWSERKDSKQASAPREEVREPETEGGSLQSNTQKTKEERVSRKSARLEGEEGVRKMARDQRRDRRENGEVGGAVCGSTPTVCPLGVGLGTMSVFTQMSAV